MNQNQFNVRSSMKLFVSLPNYEIL